MEGINKKYKTAAKLNAVINKMLKLTVMKKLILILALLAFGYLGMAAETELVTYVSKPDIKIAPQTSLLLTYNPQDEEDLALSQRTAILRLVYTRNMHTDLDGLNWEYKIQYTEENTQATGYLTVSTGDFGNIYSASEVFELGTGINALIIINSITAKNKTNGVTINLSGNNVSTSTLIPDDINLELTLVNKRVQNFNIDDAITINMAVNTAQNRLNIFWTTVTGAEEYDLEYVYIDDEFTGWSDPFLAKEPVRVRLKENKYAIDMAYPMGGDIYFRVRGIGRFTDNPDNYNIIKIGNWSNAISPYTVSVNFEENKNWIYNITYAEDGKNKQVIDYADGLGRKQQSLTRLSTNDIVVAQTDRYDYEGRPAVSIMPSPVSGKELKYRTELNQSTTTAGTIFDKKDFDKGLSNPVDDANGAGKYFSPQNDFTSDPYRNYIPDAAGYVYSQTQFTRDNTGRPSSVSGLGKKYKLHDANDTEPTHETKYFYVEPGENQLRKLFGSNMGNIEHYKKKIAKDPNGQLTASYIDQQGRTVATSLINNTTNNLLDIDNAPIADYVTERLMNNNNIQKNGIKAISKSTDEVFNAFAPGPDINFTYNFSNGVINPGFVIESSFEGGDESSFNENYNKYQDNKHIYEGNFALKSNPCTDSQYPIAMKIEVEEGDIIDVSAMAYREIPGSCASLVLSLVNEDGVVKYWDNKAPVATGEWELIRPVVYTVPSRSTLGIPSGEKIIASIHFFAAVGTVPTWFDNFKLSIKNDDICYSCKYELEITAFKPDGSPCNLNGGASNKVSASFYNTVTDNSSYVPNIDHVDFYIDAPDQEGTYKIVKELKAIDYNWDFDAIYPHIPGYNSPAELEAIYDANIDPSNCYYTCEQHYQEYLIQNNIADDPDVKKAWMAQNCDATQADMENGCNILLENLKAQVSPGGVYFDNTSSSFWSSVWAYIYVDTGEPQDADDQVADLQDVNTWTESKADFLVTFHPEYCHYSRCTFITARGYNLYRYQMAQVATLPSSTDPDYGYLNPLDITHTNTLRDPICDDFTYYPVTNGSTPIGDQLYSIFFEKININYYNNLTLFQVTDPANRPEFYGDLNLTTQVEEVNYRRWLLFRSLYDGEREKFLDQYLNATIICPYLHTDDAVVQAPFGDPPVYNGIPPEYDGSEPFDPVYFCANKSEMWLAKVENFISLTTYASTIKDYLENYCNANYDIENPYGIITPEEILISQDGNPIYELAEYMYLQGLMSYTDLEALKNAKVMSWLALIKNNCPALADALDTESDDATIMANVANVTAEFKEYIDSKLNTAIPIDNYKNLLTFILCDGIKQSDFNSNNFDDLFTLLSSVGCSDVLNYNYIQNINGLTAKYYSGHEYELAKKMIEIWNYMIKNANTNVQIINIYDFVTLGLLNFDEAGEITDKLSCEHNFDFIAYTISNNISSFAVWHTDGTHWQVTFTFGTDHIGFYDYGNDYLCIGEFDVFKQHIPPYGYGYTHNFFPNQWYVNCPEFIFPKILPTDITNPYVYTLTTNPFDDCMAELAVEAHGLAQGQFLDELENAYNQFLFTYQAQCMKGVHEDFYYTTENREYYHTLYYYDQAGNLVQTVQPEDVRTGQLNNSNFPSGIWDQTEPQYVMPVKYSFNSLNQPLVKSSPDAGFSQLKYNQLQQLRFSQDARQLVAGLFTYFKYDNLGRTIETGEYDSDAITVQEINDPNFPTTGTSKITTTVYDQPSVIHNILDQQNLRGRISGVLYHETAAGSLTAASYYSYDVHGNVEHLLQYYNGIGYKHIRYEYDLISGNVKRVNYQENSDDRFFHKYEYDADNRLTNVYTCSLPVSKDLLSVSSFWEQDAKYFYYLHGPLARVELGNDKVQGQDYAYTLQGWLKGVNSNTLYASRDIGLDAEAFGNNPNKFSGQDAYGYSLGYYNGDYNPLAIPQQYFLAADVAGTGSSTNDLFNGNIEHMVTSIRNINNSYPPDYLKPLPQLSHYRYDQLNRIKSMSVFTNYNVVTNNNWMLGPHVLSNKYATSYEYDFNGNITKLTRFTNFGSNMDDISYNYTLSGGRLQNNKLDFASDLYAPAGYSDFKTGQTSGNYQYDAAGNLISDASEQIANIEWTPAGKIKKIIRIATSEKPDIEYGYNATGNRALKIVKPKAQGGTLTDQSQWTYTYYVHDAQGNIMATYERWYTDNGGGNYTGHFSPSEYPIYGSSRIGVKKEDRNNLAEFTFTADIDNNPLSDTYKMFINMGMGDPIIGFPTTTIWGRVGNKTYELNNHLANVLTTVSDKKYAVAEQPSINIFSSFEGGDGNLFRGGDYTAQMSTLQVYSSDNSVVLNRPVDASPLQYGPTVWIKVKPGDVIDATMWGYMSNAYDAMMVVNLQNSNRAHVLKNGVAEWYADPIDNSGAWESMHITYTVPQASQLSESPDNLYIVVHSWIGTIGHEAWFDDMAVTITRGYYEIVYRPQILSTNDYYPFGFPMASRSLYSDNYDYGFQSQLKDNEIAGINGAHLAYEFREQDTRLGRFWSIDQLTSKFPYWSPYAFSGNRVIDAFELEGLEPVGMHHATAFGFFLYGGTEAQEDYYDKYYKAQVGAGEMAAEDYKVLFTGTDFSGASQSRYLAGLFVLMDVTPARVFKPVIKIAKAGIKASYRVGKIAFEFTTIARKYSDDISDLVSATGKINGGREIITTTKSALRTDAYKVTKDILGDLGDDAIAVPGKNTTAFPDANKVVKGVQSADETRGWRIDWDKNKGAHYNWWNKETGESGAILFDGTKEQVEKIQEMLTKTYNIK